MKEFKNVVNSISYIVLILLFYFISGCGRHKFIDENNLVMSHVWYLSGPTIEHQGLI